MEQVVVFTAEDEKVVTLGEKISEWLRTHPNIRITDRKQTESAAGSELRRSHYVTISIWYMEPL